MERIKAADLYEYRFLSEVTVSPDGAHTAFVARNAGSISASEGISDHSFEPTIYTAAVNDRKDAISTRLARLRFIR